MKSVLKFVLAVALFCSCNFLSAQLKGWPSSTNNLVVPNGDIIYLDSNRLGVTAVASSGSNYTLTLKSGSLSGNFNLGNFCLLISMEDAVNTGFHKSCTIVSQTSTTITVSPVDPTGWPSFVSMSKLQLVKVNTYKKITLEHAQIICHPYDENTYTGGVLAFVCDTLLMNAGYINVSGLGVAPYTTNYAMPGTGGPGSVMYMFDNGGRPQVNTPPCYTPNPITGKMLVFTSNGTSGDMGLSNGGMGGTYAYSPTIGNTTTNNNYPIRINMGQPGTLGASATAASGGGGGGHGGEGRTLAGAPVNGSPGNSGNSGDDVNFQNARGGGILIPKIKILIGDSSLVNSTVARFISDGGYGSDGGNGGMGGYGGKGGVGDTGYCGGSTINFSGANGGFGDPGDPGNGGDGTNGGQSGSIWYLSDQLFPVVGLGAGTTTNYPNPLPSLFSVGGGEAGRGGAPGLGLKVNYAETSRFDTTGCNPLEWCADTTITKICNCDSVFAQMIGKNNATYMLGGTNLKFQIGGVDFGLDTTWGVLKLVKTAKLHYYCPMSIASHFNEILKLMGRKRLTPYQTDSIADIEAVLISGKVRFRVSSTFWPIAEYDFATHTLTDLDDPARKKVKEANCLYSDAAFGGAQAMKMGAAGNDGSKYPYPGTKSVASSPFNSSANVIFYSPSPSIEEELSDNHLFSEELLVFPNPNSTGQLHFDCTEEIVFIEVVDVLGNVVLSCSPNQKQFEMNIDRLAASMYTINCKTKARIFSRKLIRFAY